MSNNELWVHCNKCGIRRSANNTVKFFILPCSHVLCEECNLAKICPIHKRPFNGIEVNQTMPHKMRILFEDPNKILTSWQKCIRFQCEQRTLIEKQEWNKVNQDNRKIRDQITVLNKYKEATLKNIQKESKCINKMKAYVMNLTQNNPTEELAESSSANITGSILSSAEDTLNASNSLGESGVYMNFDDSNSSN